MLRHPVQGVERVRGRLDRHRDKRELAAVGLPASVLYGAAEDWERLLHDALDEAWPCQEPASFGRVWDRVLTELTQAGARVGMGSYGGWNDGDRAFAQGIWCLVAHLRPKTVVETGVAHGLSSRMILEGLDRNGDGHLWSIDLPAVDSALHPQIGMAVPERLRSGWSYVQGTARARLPGLLDRLGTIDIFIHDSLHTGRNQRFELESAWAAMRFRGAAVVDDIDHSLAFRDFVERARPRAWVAARHVTGHGLWGLAIKGLDPPAGTVPQAHRPSRVRRPTKQSLRRVPPACGPSKPARRTPRPSTTPPPTGLRPPGGRSMRRWPNAARPEHTEALGL
jgi:Methyltransferase domain